MPSPTPNDEPAMATDHGGFKLVFDDTSTHEEADECLLPRPIRAV